MKIQIFSSPFWYTNKLLLILSIVIFVFLGFFILQIVNKGKMQTKSVIRYVSIGDSYSNGEGATTNDSFPVLLTKDLQEKNVNIQLIINPSVTGWTSQQVIDNELPLFDDANPTFATLLIGVNDWVQGVSADYYRKNLIFIIDHMEDKLINKKHLILITIPDFSVTPTGMKFSNGRNIKEGISQFNSILKEEGKKRGLTVIDIYPLTEKMLNNLDLIAADGLHPSGKEYKLWEQIIFPPVYSLLK